PPPNSTLFPYTTLFRSEREGNSPGWKFNDWEMRGVPLLVELGPKDVAKQAAVLARRDRPGREGKVSASLAGLPATIERLLAEIRSEEHTSELQSRFDLV